MKHKKTNLISKIFLAFVFLTAVIVICKFIKEENNPQTTVNSTVSNLKNEQNSEMFGVWVSYLDLNINSPINTEEIFKSKFDDIVKTSKQNKINTLIVQVRPFGDALYPSTIFPWSHILTGVQGENPNFDPLKYMVEKSHKNDLKIHAWINPMRIKLSECPHNLSKDNPYFKLSNEKYYIKREKELYYNPSYPEIRELITSGVREIVENYNVDGVHMDDYFYPENDGECTFNQYNNLSKIESVNLLIKDIYQTIKSIKSNVLFGISPPGNLEKCKLIGADIETWISEKNYIDYICPQIYWSTDFSVMPFKSTAEKWKNLLQVANGNIKIYSGLALYKVNTDADKGTWKNKNTILAEEFRICKNLKFNGIALYSYGFLKNEKTKEEMQNLLKEIEKA